MCVKITFDVVLLFHTQHMCNVQVDDNVICGILINGIINFVLL